MALGHLLLGPPDTDQEAEDDIDLQRQALNLGVDMDLLDEPPDDENPQEQEDSPVFYIWHEHRKVWEVWLRLQSQWVIGETGPTGLNYQGVDVVLRRSGLSHREADHMFAQIQHLEAGARKGYAEARQAKRPQPDT